MSAAKIIEFNLSYKEFYGHTDLPALFPRENSAHDSQQVSLGITQFSLRL